MGDIRLNISVKEENNILFKRCIRKLLESTFIVGDKEEKLYAFISRESNRQDISDYLRMIGFDVFVDTNVRIAMLKPYEADEEAVGLKRANVVSFTTEQYHLLLVLWEVYLENLGYNDENVVMRGDLIDKIKVYEVDLDKAKLSAAMKIFKKYNLIDYDAKDESEDAIITLYPSLQFGWDIAQFQTVTAEYMKNDLEEDEEEASDTTGEEEDE
ncbi:DUF4194 domain-containing protein [Murimonas intestini]|uniref:Uncharacterized protein DUF4194 n=1 Tax=Murimonas intestini TaxID=1337051 RepID=A0AB73T430_9FIRM|nr:DUF4194 domain-containing protein [Murimonas intestini]MCR1840857.1 DUF4194 domain-containing protein [Murimonas intestini]MCR1866024.1 DUF4194 domain-containing protein [Murimonas intestini]MCR1883444.1 DUF4194 domain-containing protein [Murimonas intestini]